MLFNTQDGGQSNPNPTLIRHTIVNLHLILYFHFIPYPHLHSISDNNTKDLFYFILFYFILFIVRFEAKKWNEIQELKRRETKQKNNLLEFLYYLFLLSML